ncbi:glucose-6-phosphate isomerase [Shewanella oneidensis MR-1]|uniref:Glucose-6-phosphate isomerase n=1 Tax=Shewanella oneidensis (strain ATCC 700550 / JCM 31522 / CIP 106686 / LMG 19005 / NCIMB 14063 / MR-1) TaxID=211586 RepID=G6PI_SHEON|nr:glucose-6-phosphate isomerase [Shewanella oneidensis]Q8EBH1.1 RecName: Full=Glucose-6-phosphate isomerase; Short=GPI; AltName: Full=Phosphoglucose isomerase; Short=PGI; AltName: Full=Phosphohexose isomerase; Short=PHI [Shewanella oneidensis MR-1]AAN56538.1 glucose-6-phosphate isomerase Pgi [Shewanella oneidensis MR-1]MDX5999060.1 glucose-6-phosphate isomerase [Shewanella oneidensis]MEE2029181.1 Glucose-6-phosphate isomerase [Shewanella oneidensis]QKG97915.1 glucose-6-phosphate isomerase [Sh
MTILTQSTTWQALSAHSQDIPHMRELFAADPARFTKMSLSSCGLFLDYSKNRATPETLNLLFALAQEAKLDAKIKAMFAGDIINTTEKRAVLHTALRNTAEQCIIAEGQDIVPEVQQTLNKMQQFVTSVTSGQWKGYTGKAITDIVSIGIGGSFLGPKIVSQALRPYWITGLNCHFVANVDGTSISEKLKLLDPETTLFIMSSKSFGTQETLTNTLTAKAWFLAKGGSQSDVAKHFAAVTSNVVKATGFGIDANNIFPMWDWVGGRYSLWSAIGLPIALLIGMDNFRALLKGAHQMDTHFANAPLTENMPVIMGLLSLWYGNFFNAQSHVVLTYDHYLRGLPAYFQQLDMESNGKSVTLNGTHVDYSTGPVIWGGEGTNGQHAYHQLLHQGTALIPADFIMPLQSHNPIGEHHDQLASNCFGQTQALMQGRTLDEALAELSKSALSNEEKLLIAKHKVMSGNKPSNTLLMDKLTPETLGALIALYEHRTFVQGAIWDINSFDQWGVELGKTLGNDVLTRIGADQEATVLDASSNGLINLYRRGKI